MGKRKIIKKALVSCKNKLKESPTFQPLRSIEIQLQYLYDLANGKKIDSYRLNEIIIGVYAAKEVECRDMDFANLLYEVEEIVDLLKKQI